MEEEEAPLDLTTNRSHTVQHRKVVPLAKAPPFQPNCDEAHTRTNSTHTSGYQRLSQHVNPFMSPIEPRNRTSSVISNPTNQQTAASGSANQTTRVISFKDSPDYSIIHFTPQSTQNQQLMPSNSLMSRQPLPIQPKMTPRMPHPTVRNSGHLTNGLQYKTILPRTINSKQPVISQHSINTLAAESRPHLRPPVRQRQLHSQQPPSLPHITNRPPVNGLIRPVTISPTAFSDGHTRSISSREDVKSEASVIAVSPVRPTSCVAEFQRPSEPLAPTAANRRPVNPSHPMIAFRRLVPSPITQNNHRTSIRGQNLLLLSPQDYALYSLQPDVDNNFTWADYLEASDSSVAKISCFPHVMRSLDNFLPVGCLVELRNHMTENPDEETYWVARIVHSCGRFLVVNFVGTTSEVWVNLMNEPVHRIGWCFANNKPYIPPTDAEIQGNPVEFLRTYLTGAESVSEEIIQQRQFWPVTYRISPGVRYEVEYAPNRIWLAVVQENYAGLLRLRFEGLSNDRHDFCLFYLSPKLHPVGYFLDHQVEILPPESVASVAPDEILLISVYQQGMKKAELFTSNIQMPPTKNNKPWLADLGQLQVGMALEALNPRFPAQVMPATVTKIIDDVYFEVTFDLLDSGSCALPGGGANSFITHAGAFGIFPVNWCYDNGIPLHVAQHSSFSFDFGRQFDWGSYLRKCHKNAVPFQFFCHPDGCVKHNFTENDKVELLHPLASKMLCPATIVKVIQRVLIVRVDGWFDTKGSSIEFIIDAFGQDLFPVGFAERSGAGLHAPPSSLMQQFHKTSFEDDIDKVNQLTTSESESQENSTKSESLNSSSSSSQSNSCEVSRSTALHSLVRNQNLGVFYCPELYVNHRCKSSLSRLKLASMPKVLGPGLVAYVMHTVITEIVNCAHKPLPALRDVVALYGCCDDPATTGQVKVKGKTKNFKANVRLVTRVGQISDYLSAVLTKLDTCPNLISFHPSTPSGCCDSPSCIEHMASLAESDYLENHMDGMLTERRRGFPGVPGRKRKKRSRQMYKKRQFDPNLVTKPTLIASGNSDDDSALSRSATPCPPSDDSGEEKPVLNEDDLNKLIIVESKRALKPPKVLNPPEREKSKRHKSMYSTVNMKHKFEEEKMISIAKTQSKIHSGLRPGRPRIHPENHKPSPPATLDKPVQSNPLNWTTDELVDYLNTTDASEFAKTIKAEQFDGQAFLLLSLPFIMEFLGAKLGPALKVCHVIEKLKTASLLQFDNQSKL